jgi:peptidoglycan/LPS O-acetylase OafA/YrhL
VAFLGILLALYGLDCWPVYVPCLVAVLFFAVGAYLRMYKIALFSQDKYFVHLASVFVVLIIIGTSFRDARFSLYLDKISIFMGVAAVLASTHLLHSTKRIKRALLALSDYSFFVFAFHEPFLTLMKKWLFVIIKPIGTIEVTAIYFIAPTITIFTSITIFYCLKKILPGFSSVITGGR